MLAGRWLLHRREFLDALTDQDVDSTLSFYFVSYLIFSMTLYCPFLPPFTLLPPKKYYSVMDQVLTDSKRKDKLKLGDGVHQ